MSKSIINGIDVSECKNFSCGICEEENKIPRTIVHFTADCAFYPNCYFKQLKRLQEENEKLKEKIKSEKYIKENALQEATKYSMKCGEFRQALEEIRNEIGDLKDINKLINLQKILDKINEALK